MDPMGQRRHKESAKSSSFYRTVYSEIEEIGWERVRRFGADLTYLSFHTLDEKGRTHVLEIQLDKDYPKCPPSVSADVPYMFDIKWSASSRLKDIMHQFEKHLQRLQEFWSVLDDIDKSLCVVDAKQPSRATPLRQIHRGNDCVILIHINVDDPKSLPESNERSFAENFRYLLETDLPRPPGVQEEEDHHQQVECGICYAHCLPIDDELGARSGIQPDYTCDNTSCNKAFHSLCLTDWLRSITTTRQSFDVLFGNCPYCSDPVAVKINMRR